MVASASSHSGHITPGHVDPVGPTEYRSVLTRGGVLIIGGPDGAGKSTLAAEIIGEVLSEVPVMHIRFPRLLPRRNRERARARRLGKDATPNLIGPRAYPPTYPWGTSMWKALYLFIDFMLGWRMRVGPFVRSGGWVVFERGWWDHAVDPRRYRLRSGRPFIVLGRLIPRADLILILEADPATIHARKPQLSTEELARQMTVWHRILPRTQRRIFLDAALPVAHLIEQVRAHVSDLNTRRPE
ncbi:MAG: hypothetical protein M3454_09305 [Actinomycetota bacterium]|nr:hypothetical protein [Actinomycetota bacterium]